MISILNITVLQKVEILVDLGELVVTSQDDLPARRQSPIQVLTEPDVDEDHQRVNHYTKSRQ